MSLRMSSEAYQTWRNFWRWVHITVVFWLFIGLWTIPGCQTILPDTAKAGFAELDRIVQEL